MMEWWCDDGTDSVWPYNRPHLLNRKVEFFRDNVRPNNTWMTEIQMESDERLFVRVDGNVDPRFHHSVGSRCVIEWCMNSVLGFKEF